MTLGGLDNNGVPTPVGNNVHFSYFLDWLD